MEKKYRWWGWGGQVVWQRPRGEKDNVSGVAGGSCVGRGVGMGAGASGVGSVGNRPERSGCEQRCSGSCPGLGVICCPLESGRVGNGPWLGSRIAGWSRSGRRFGSGPSPARDLVTPWSQAGCGSSVP